MSRTFFRNFSKISFLTASVVAATLMCGVVTASAQFFGGAPQRQLPSNGGFGGGGWFGGDIFAPFQQTPRPYLRRRAVPKRALLPRPFTRQPVEDASKAPLPEKRETPPERNVLVLGDGMADWLGYGLEQAYVEQPNIGVIRKIKAVSGLLKYQTQGDPSDWAAAVKNILANEQPSVIVVLLGMEDRIPIRELPADKTGKKTDKKSDRDIRPGTKSDAVEKSQNKDPDTELPQDEAVEYGDAGSEPVPGTSTRSPNGFHQFRDERWVELYNSKIEKMIRQLKSKGVPVLWVGLPAIRGTSATSDMLFINALYRAAAAKAGIAYVDVWEGFVDEAGRFLVKGPDLEGQIRQLRSSDGIYFTKPGARKLAHYAEQEINRVFAALTTPPILPTEPATPDANAVPGRPTPRPLSGLILPLVEPPVVTDRLMGGPNIPSANFDTIAARMLVRGEPLTPPAGRADDYVWPRREVGSERIRDETPMANK